MAAASKRIVVQVTAQEKMAIAAKAQKLGLSIAELMRRGVAAYESKVPDEKLRVLPDIVMEATTFASEAIDDSLSFAHASNQRIAEMEAKALASKVA